MVFSNNQKIEGWLSKKQTSYLFQNWGRKGLKKSVLDGNRISCFRREHMEKYEHFGLRVVF